MSTFEEILVILIEIHCKKTEKRMESKSHINDIAKDLVPSRVIADYELQNR